MRILSVVGARPQFLKTALLSRELRKKFDEDIIHTGQHYDYNLSKSFFDLLSIPEPKYNLQIGSGPHGMQTGKMLMALEECFIKESPDLVIVFGDTNSTLAGSLAACKLHIPVYHVEAGLRNFDKSKPEEINRLVTDRVADVFFAPTENAVKNLNNEGIYDNIYVTGDISYDIFKIALEKALAFSGILNELGLNKGEYLLCTIHKSKHTDIEENLKAIIHNLFEIDFPILFPCHPRTKNYLEKYGLMKAISESNIQLIEPLEYYDFIKVLASCKKLITDSGGIQKEAYALKIPCITLRKTEWVETVKYGWNKEVNIHNKEEMIQTINLFEGSPTYVNFLGNGDAHKIITQIICELNGY